MAVLRQYVERVGQSFSSKFEEKREGRMIHHHPNTHRPEPKWRMMWFIQGDRVFPARYS
jgi:hypothetical protein